MTDENASLPPAGWYPDPEVPGGERWWDGTAWSTHQRAGTVAAEPAPAEPAAAAEPVPPTAPVTPAEPVPPAEPVHPAEVAAPAYAYAPSQPPAASPYVAPPAYGYAAYGAYAAPQPANVPALVGLILSIVGLALGWLIGFLALAAVAGLVVSIVGLRTGARMRAQGNPNHRWGLALAGTIVGGVGTLIGGIVVIGAIVLFAQYATYYPY